MVDAWVMMMARNRGMSAVRRASKKVFTTIEGKGIGGKDGKGKKAYPVSNDSMREYQEVRSLSSPLLIHLVECGYLCVMTPVDCII